MGYYPGQRKKFLPWKKAASLVLLFSLLTSPSAAYAQSEEVSSTPEPESTQEPAIIEPEPTQEEVEQETPVTPETPVQEESSEEEALGLEGVEEPQALMSSGSSGTEAGAIFINNETTRSVIPEVDTQTGALTFGYGITVPPGRGSMTPDVRLMYNSGSAGNTSLFGYGWSLSIPTIYRVNRLGTNNLYGSSTVFQSSLDGELVQVGTTSEYRPRVDGGEFRKYTFSDDAWTIEDKMGSRMFLGSTTAARRSDPSDASRIFSWHLEEQRDANDNYVKYEYFKDAGQIYPETITYTGHGTTDGDFTVDFTRESRNDNLLSYETGFAATTTYRISQIETAIGGSWVGRYELDYTAGHNGNRSLLGSITRSGRDELGTITTLPSTNFTYESYTGGNKGWTEDAGWYVPVNIAREEIGYDDGARFVDVNGDTLIDIVASSFTDFNPNNPATLDTNIVYLNTGEEWATSTEWELPTPEDGRFGLSGGYIPETGQGTLDNGARFADVNKDGFTDILWAYTADGAEISYSFNYTIRDVYINNGIDGWATTTEWELPSEYKFSHDASDRGGRVADVNGDSLVDLIQGTDVYLNTGSGWEAAASSTWEVPEPFYVVGINGNVPMGTELADVNGDGLTDVVRRLESDKSGGYADVNKVYLNTGEGWELASSWSIPVPFVYQENTGAAKVHGMSTRFIDVNGDNLTDLMSSASSTAGGIPETNTVYINTGEGWLEDSSWGDPPPFKFSYTSGGVQHTEAGVAQMDVDGDNMIDFVRSGPSGVAPAPHVKGVYLHDGRVPDILSSIQYPEGGEVSIAYEQSARYEDGANNANPDMPFNLNTVEEVTYDDGETTPYSQNYFYGGGDLYFASSTDNQPAGFATTTKEDARGNITKTYIHQGNGSQTTLGENSDNFSKIGKPFLTEKYDNAANLYDRKIRWWESTSTGTDTSFVYPVREVTQQYDGDGDHRDSAIEFTYDSSNGNLASTTEWGEVSGSADGTFSDTGSDRRTTIYSYASSSSSYLIVPSETLVTNQSATKVRESRMYYDNEALGDATEGNLTKQENWISSSDYAENVWTYNSYGLVTTEVGPRNATTTYSYDARNLYPILTTNALSQTASSTYDYTVGKPKATTNPNGYVSEWRYDGFDRVLEEKHPDAAIGTSVVVRTNDYDDSRNSVAVETNAYLTASSSVPTFQYFDGFGRKIQERTRAEEEDVFMVRDWIYGDDGLLAEESLPYFGEDEALDDPSSANELFTVYEYDPLNRVTSVENVLGETVTAYDQWEESIIDPLGNVKDYTYDAYGRLVSVDEHNDASTYTTAYEWDLNDNLTKVTDALANVRNFTYDGLNRRTSAEDLHDVADGTFGTWQFEYDAVGNLIESTDPKSQVVETAYDLLNRPLTENYTGTGGTEVSYGYDSCLNGVGQLCVATSTGAVTRFEYTPSGLPSSETKVIGASTYETEYSYDRLGNRLEVTYPDGSAARYAYNAAGKVETVEQKETGASYESVVTDVDYDANGEISYYENANCTYVRNIYDEEELYRLRQKTADRLECAEESMLMGGSMDEEGPYSFSAFYDENGLVPGLVEESIAETLSESLVAESFGTSTPSLALMTQEAAVDAIELPATTTESSQKPGREKKGNPFKAPFAEHLGMKDDQGLVTYAYRTNTKVESVPVAKETVKKAREAGVRVGNEVLEKRTKYARTFATDREGVFVTEIIAGKPQYYKDEKGEWWIADYGTTTRESYDEQVKGEQGAKKDKISFGSMLNAVLSFFMPSRAYAGSSTFYPDPHTETTSVDGELYKDNSTTWSTVRNATESNWGGDSGSGNNVRDHIGNGNGPDHYGIRRAFLLFDTSALPDGASITSASLNVFISGYSAAGSEKRMYVVSSNPASNTSISYDDYDLIGSTSFGESDGSYSINTYEPITLNSSGLAAITKTGVSKFALRTYNDFNNVPSTNSNELDIDFWSAERGGTGEDPKLVVVYNTEPSIPIVLKTEGQTNPTELSDLTPEFSAVFIDADIDDEGDSYRIQVSASSTDFSSPVWDSQKQSLPDEIGNGYRSQELSYAGTALTPLSTYYWRIKFWDIGDVEGAWSTTTASFSVSPAPLAFFNSVYGYDAVGNITSITDIRNIDAPVATVYGYDDLYRLLSVGTTTATLENHGGSTVVQPDSSNGKDTNYGTVYHLTGDPNAETMWVGGWYDEYFTYIRFALGSIPDADDIEYAKLHLYNTSSTTANEAKLLRVTESWTESSVTESVHPAATDIGMAWQSIPSNGWWVVDVTQTVKDWKDGTHSNHGFMVDARYTTPNNYVQQFAASEYATSTYRPKLEVKKLGEEADAPTVTLGVSVATTSTYTYNAIGNLLTKSDLGSFTYGETGLANPHAATVINGLGLSYDNNGNVTGYGTAGYAWDYRNRMSSAGNGTATSTYAYDHSIARVSKTVGGVTTRYPSNLYEHSSATTTKHLYLGDTLVASVNGTGTTTASTTWAYQDHLNSTRVVTNEDGDPIQSLSYTPFGAQESNVASTSIQQSNRYIGQVYDEESDLSYLQARMYNGANGKFLSQDPTFLAIGDNQKLQTLIQRDQTEVLKNPQSLNSYSYALNNPITFKDPEGEYFEIGASGTYSVFSGSVGLQVSLNGVNFVASGGLGAGVGAYPFSVSYTPGDVSHEMDVSTTLGGSAAYGIGAGYEVSGDYEPYTSNLNNSSQEISVVIGAGADTYARREVTVPILGGQAPEGVILDKGSRYSTPNYIPAPTKNKNETLSKPAGTVISAPATGQDKKKNR